MAELKSIIEENARERERLVSLLNALRESDYARVLPNGWTIGVALAHIAFWDLRAARLLEKWIQEGGQGPVLPLDADVVNAPLAVLSAAIPPKNIQKLAAEAAEKADGLVAGMTQAQVDEFLKAGSERFLLRALHRGEHLDKIE